MTFEKVKIGDEVYGTVYGSGIVVNVFKNSHYTFEVEYTNKETNDGQIVNYTVEGIPSWGAKIGEQTVFYKTEIDLMEYDFEPTEKVLTPKDILTLKIKNELEIRCPSGIWMDVFKCNKEVFESYVMNEKFHLFRTKRN
jgi:hypothetical protein